MFTLYISTIHMTVYYSLLLATRTLLWGHGALVWSDLQAGLVRGSLDPLVCCVVLCCVLCVVGLTFRLVWSVGPWTLWCVVVLCCVVVCCSGVLWV